MNEKKDEDLKNPFADAPVIFTYTRAQAIEDGVLVDLSEWAKETGFKIPVACTSEVWHSYITPPQGARELGQAEDGCEIGWREDCVSGFAEGLHQAAGGNDECGFGGAGMAFND